MTPAELKRELAVYLFQQGKLSFGKAREMADMSAWDFQFMLGSRNIPVHYDMEDYEEDRATLRSLVVCECGEQCFSTHRPSPDR